MSAENPVDVSQLGVMQCSGGDLGPKAEPPCVQAIESSRDRLRAPLDLLDMPIDFQADAADHQVAAAEPVELVSVNCQVSSSLVGPDVALIDRHSD